jgi:hypothetical protein
MGDEDAQLDGEPEPDGQDEEQPDGPVEASNHE